MDGVMGRTGDARIYFEGGAAAGSQPADRPGADREFYSPDRVPGFAAQKSRHPGSGNLTTVEDKRRHPESMLKKLGSSYGSAPSS
jgi:hypothetical protein